VNRVSGHPEDFGPYLDRDSSDPKYEEIRRHLDACVPCQDELRNWQSFDSTFRSGAAEIEVPPFQWQRIAAQIQTPTPIGILARLRPLFQPWKLAWNVTLATILLGAVIFSGIEYRKDFEEKQLLLAITRYSQEEGERIAADGNPFQTAGAERNNPFARSPFAGESRPSAERR
jgi:hypothetical protein